MVVDLRVDRGLCTDRAETGPGLLAPGMPTVRAIASDCGAEFGELPGFDLDDTGAIADFIAAELGL